MDGCSRQNPAYRPAPEMGSRRREPIRFVPGPFPLDGTCTALYPFAQGHHSNTSSLSHRTERRELAPAGDAQGDCADRSLRSPSATLRGNMCSMIVCVQLPRFALVVAARGRDVLAAGPVALAPEPGCEQFIGEVSAAAEAYGVRAGLRL